MARILIVDDNAVNRAVLKDLLISIGHTPLLEENGLAALEQIRREPPELVLLDILMPKMDGYAVLEQMMAAETLRHIPVIMITAIDEIQSVVRCIEAGADDYLIKPFNPALLNARIHAGLEKNRLRRQEQRLQQELSNQAQELIRAQLAGVVLHNIGNAITPVKIRIEQMKNGELPQIYAYLEQCYADLKDHLPDLQHYVNEDSRGREVFAYLGQLVDSLRNYADQELGMLGKIDAAVSQIMELLNAQQAYASDKDSDG